eukprot:gene4336-7692_t
MILFCFDAKIEKQRVVILSDNSFENKKNEFHIKKIGQVNLNNDDVQIIRKLNNNYESNTFILINETSKKLHLDGPTSFDELLRKISKQIEEKNIDILPLTKELSIQDLTKKYKDSEINISYEKTPKQIYTIDRFVHKASLSTTEKNVVKDQYSNFKMKITVRDQPFIVAKKHTMEYWLLPEFCQLKSFDKSNLTQFKNSAEFIQILDNLSNENVDNEEEDEREEEKNEISIIKTDKNEKYYQLKKKLNFKFNNNELLDQSLNKWKNEKLEYLGDAILGIIIFQLLYEKLPNITQTALVSLYELMSSNETLYHFANSTGISDFIVFNKKKDDKDYSDCVEALIGGLYLDQGYDKTEEFILNNYFIIADEMIEKYSKNDQTVQSYKDPEIIKNIDENVKKLEFKKISKLERDIKYVFQNKFLALESLTHDISLKNEEYNFTSDRLYSLGDIVMKTIVVEYLYKKYPQFHGAILTKIQSTFMEKSYIELFPYNFKDYIRAQEGDYVSKKSQIAPVIGAMFLEQNGFRNKNDNFLHLKNDFLISLLNSFSKDIKSKDDFTIEHRRIIIKKKNQNLEFEVIARSESGTPTIVVSLNFFGKPVAFASGINQEIAKKSAKEKGEFIQKKIKKKNLKVSCFEDITPILEKNRDYLYECNGLMSKNLKILKYESVVTKVIERMKQ